MTQSFFISKRAVLACALPVIAALACVLDASAAGAQTATHNAVGINSYATLDWARNRPFADMMKTARELMLIGAPSTPAPIDARGWPTTDAQTLVVNGLERIDGTYAFSCAGRVTLDVPMATVSDLQYNPVTNRTTASVRVSDPAMHSMVMRLTGTTGGVQDIRLMRPTQPGATTSYPEGQVFTDAFLDLVGRFELIRTMDWLATNSSFQISWSDRVLPSYASFNRHDDRYGWQGRGAAWEYVIMLANEAGKDVWINVPDLATDDYVRRLAQLFRDGSTIDGVTYPPLDPELDLYVEYSNELWNGFVDFEQAERNREAAIAEVAYGNSPLDFDGETSASIWQWRRVAKRGVEISNILRGVFGSTQMMRRIKPILAWQQDDGQGTGSAALDFVDRYYGAVHPGNATPYPVPWLFYGGGGSAYYGPERDRTDLTLSSVWSSATMDIDAWRAVLLRDAQLTLAYGLKRIAYEGGPSLEGDASADVKRAAWADPRMTTLFIAQHDAWSEMNGDLLAYFADADSSRAWGFVEEVVTPLVITPKLAAIDTLTSANRTRARSTMGQVLPLDRAGGVFDDCRPRWLATAYGGQATISLESARQTSEGRSQSDWLLYIVRNPTNEPMTATLRLDYERGTTDASVLVRVDGYPLHEIAVAGGGSATRTVVLGPGSHGLVLRASAGAFTLRRVVLTDAFASIAVPMQPPTALGALVLSLLACATLFARSHARRR